MPGQNDFRAFAAGGGANALTPAAYAALTALLANGFQAGTASSAQINTVLRQSSSMAAALGKIISDAELNAVDDGNVTTLAARIVGALQTMFSPASGVIRAWQNLSASRAANTVYQNTTGYEIFVAIRAFRTSGDGRLIEVSPDASAWIVVGGTGQTDDGENSGFPVPNGWYYRINGTVSATDFYWAELRKV